MKKSSLAAIVVAVLGLFSLTSCNSDSLVAFFHSPGITILYVGDDVEFPPADPADPAGPGGRGNGRVGGGGGGGAQANGVATTTTLATFTSDRYRVRKFEERDNGIFYTISDLEGHVLRERIRKETFSLSMPSLLREMEQSLALGS